MNKIIVDEYEENYCDIKNILEVRKNDAHIHLSGTNQITDILMTDTNKITITLEDDATLILNTNWLDLRKNLEVIINCKNHTNLESHCYIENEKDFYLDFKTNLEGNNNKCKILFSVVTEESGKCLIKTTGRVFKNTKENEFLEEVKGLSLQTPSISFLPELIVDSMDVIANHNATIKCIDEEELFYLESKGIKKEDAVLLIKKGFLNQLNKREVEKDES